MFHFIRLSLIFIVVLSGCAGGSEGTGSVPQGRTLEGQIVNVSNVPVEDATVTVIDNGNSTQTDALGNFSLMIPESTSEVTLEVQSQNVNDSITVSDLDPEATSINVSLVADPQKNEITATNLQVWSRIVGDCDRYFENRAIIRQSNKIPNPEISCTMRFFVSGDGKRLERIPGAIQVRACNRTTWRTIANGKTGFGIGAGVGEIDFTFIDNERNCEYRVAAPFNMGDKKTLFVYLETLTLQAKK